MEITNAVTALTALAQETRLAVFRLLVEAGAVGMAPGVIGEKLEVPAATLSFHLKTLSQAGLITARHDGRFIYYAVDFERMAALMSFLTHNYCRGMPQECLSVMETALSQCCAPVRSKRKPVRARS